jgi:hypothetical protein
MASRRSRPHRLLLPAILAAILAAEITGLALARTFVPANSAPPAPVARAGVVSAAIGSYRAGSDVAPSRIDHPVEKFRAAAATTKPKTSSTSGSDHGTSSSASTSYHGRNHVWIPSLGIDKAVQSFPCSRNRPPDAGAYRWGCAGRNNVYLMSHAWSTFKPLHDAYVGGRLHAGMRVTYADGSGQVHIYSVSWWRVVKPTTAASWAWAALSQPSITLQTCVGANSAYRLMVRLSQVG